MFILINYLIRVWKRRQARRASENASAPAEATPPETDGEAEAERPPVRSQSDDRPSAAARGPLALIAHQVHYDVLTSIRNPRARFFTLFFPILLLVVFNGVFGNGTTVVDGTHVQLKVFYVPGILAMSIVVATYANLVISLATLRDKGVLKRRRATPVPSALLIAGQALSAVVITALTSAILLVLAKLLYGVGMAPAAIAAVACTALVATLAFACIAYAVAGLIGSPDAAQPIVQATMLPLWFISGVFIPIPSLSNTLRRIGDVFPVEHLANSLHLASVNSSFASALSGTDLLVLAAWAVGAAAFAAWRFSWLPSSASA
jgi:ABC-2 type transport system permease protein